MDIVPITIFREAGGEGPAGMLGVAWVIQNRASSGRRMWPTDPEKVCLQRKQFSCWNDSDSTRDKYPDPADPVYRQCLAAWREASFGTSLDPTGSAYYYVNPEAVTVNPFATPQYRETAVIGKHHFYREVDA